MVRRALVVVATAVAAGLAGLAGPAAALASGGYFEAPFTLTTHSASFGQAPVFMPAPRNGAKQQVVFGQDYKQGEKNQAYIWNFDGSGQPECLTCTGDPIANDPNNVNGVPAVRSRATGFCSTPGAGTT